MLRVGLIALCLLLAGCGQGKDYARPMGAMHEALASVDELPPAFGSALTQLAMETSDPASVTWIVELDGSEVMRFVARLEPRGEARTHMDLDLVGVTSGARGNVAERLEKHPELKRLYLAAMAEQIDSTLEGRKFDASKTYRALAAATAAMRP